MYAEQLIALYDNFWAVADITPISHIRVNFDFAVLLDKNGYKMAAEIHRAAAVPCTVASETRTSNVAPHLMHDNLGYVANLPNYQKHHKSYLSQLQAYVDATNDEYAKTVLAYVRSDKILEHLEPVISKSKIRKPLEKINVCFLVYPATDLINTNWINYHVSCLSKNGICIVTGNQDYIPTAYPAKIRNETDFAKLFVDSSSVGYIASQKIIHTLQMLCRDEDNDLNDINISNYYI